MYKNVSFKILKRRYQKVGKYIYLKRNFDLVLSKRFMLFDLFTSTIN